MRKTSVFTLIFCMLSVVFFQGAAAASERLGGTIDVFEDTLAFPYEDQTSNGTSLYVFHMTTNEVVKLTDAEEGTYHSQPVFSMDGDYLTYIEGTFRTEDSQPTAQLHVIHLPTMQVIAITPEGSLVGSTATSPVDDMLYYAKAEVFTNYSPIARAAPHDINLYSYPLPLGPTTQITNEDAYDMSDLSVSADGESVYYGDFVYLGPNPTPSSEVRQSLLELDLSQPDEATRIAPEDNEDLYAPTLSHDGKTLAFIRPVNKGERDPLFIYELYTMDMDTKDITQLTSLGTNVHSAAFSTDDKSIYFIENKTFGQRKSDFVYHCYDLETGEVTELAIEEVLD
ncbi:TolB family protein [Aureibacillus halotolerans]|uniref:WD40 repeat protein n=1 Tax=Aureibacillus halotolerans TaxID=1508390 RepID=A0A4R6TYQ9_9BACI|nr:PD40 domain-containing protein [Aureibacillus halotolerans]TDQ37179.1 WD40 repeat protein [Aureibacillus halotolerans]